MEQLHALSSWYLEQLERHPLLTKSLTASAITGASNVVAQCLGNARRAVDGDVVGGDCDQRRVTSSTSTSSTSTSSSSARVNKVELVKYLLFGLLWVGSELALLAECVGAAGASAGAGEQGVVGVAEDVL